MDDTKHHTKDENKRVKCIACSNMFLGRIDKKFCSEECKNKYHNERRTNDNEATKQIRLALNKNRNILRRALGGDKATTVEYKRLVKKGFDFDYHTHHHKTNKGEYIFCFDYGWLDLGGGRYMVVKTLNKPEKE